MQPAPAHFAIAGDLNNGTANAYFRTIRMDKQVHSAAIGRFVLLIRWLACSDLGYLLTPCLSPTSRYKHLRTGNTIICW